MSNTVTLTVTFTFTEDADVTRKDKEAIIENVIESFKNQINSGMGIAPEDPEKDDYITDFVDVRDEKGMGLTYNFKENSYM